MNTIGIRIDVPTEIHNLLNEEQKRRKTTTGKTTPLSSIALEWLTCGLQMNLAGITTSYQDSVNGDSTLKVQQKAIEVTQKEKQLDDKENRLRVWENDISQKEKNIRIQEKELYNQYDELYSSKDDFLNEKEKWMKKIAETSVTKIQLEDLSEKLKQKDDEIRTLKEDKKFFKKTVLERLDEKSDSNVWREWIIPILPSALLILEYLLRKNKSAKNIEELFKDFDPKNKQEIIDKLISILNSDKTKK
ncbi:MAG: hypothetical protein WCH34_07475 [Bacteroidota bacterium]